MNTVALSLDINDDLCDICRQPGFLEHTDCLLKFTGNLLSEVLTSMDNNSFSKTSSNTSTNTSSNTSTNNTNNSNTSIDSTKNILNTPIVLDASLLHKLVCRVPVQYFDQFENKIYYKANSKKLRNIKKYMHKDPNFKELETNYNDYIKDLQVSINLDHPNYWYMHISTNVKDLSNNELEHIYNSLNEGLQTTLAMFTTEFTGPFQFVSFR